MPKKSANLLSGARNGFQQPASCHVDRSWAADYLDGRSAARQHAIVRVGKSALELVTGTGFTRRWPYTAMTQTQGEYKGEPVRFEYGSEPVESWQLPTILC